MIMLLLFVIGAAGVGGYLYIKMKGVKPASKKNQPDPDADYHDEDCLLYTSRKTTLTEKMRRAVRYKAMRTGQCGIHG